MALTVADRAVGAPGWWLQRLDDRLRTRRWRYDRLLCYYRGDHDLPEGDKRAREAYKQFQRKARSNYMRMVADAVSERLRVVGFMTGGEQDEGSDQDAWRIWQASHLDADQGLVHLSSLIFSDSYVCVGPPEVDGLDPVITPEDPRQMIAEVDPVNRRRLRAALKTWVDDVDGLRHAVLYLPDGFHYFKQQIDAETETLRRDVWPYSVSRMDDDRWDREDPGAVENPLGEVPVVRFVGLPTIEGEGLGEFEDLMDLQDRINSTILDRLVITKMQAYRQRWATGVQTAQTDEEETQDGFGNRQGPAPGLVPGVDLLWAVEDPEVKFGDFEQADLGPILAAVKADVVELATRASLPPTYIQGDIVNASADAIAAIEARLVAKVSDRAFQFGEGWEQVMRLAFSYLGEPDRISPDASVQWQDPERKSDAQLADAGLKKQQAGVPWRQLMSDLRYTPQQIDRMEADRMADAMVNALQAPPPAPVAQDTQGQPPAPPGGPGGSAGVPPNGSVA